MELVFNKRERKTRVLIEGWINIPHSYAIVNCLQLVHMIKLQDKYNLEFYVRETEYYNPNWNNNKKLMFSQEYNDILTNLKQWNANIEIDLIYRISYPYNISIYSDQKHIPTCVFFTSEFATLDVKYFKLNSPNYKVVDDHLLELHMKNNKNLSFVTPSEWSLLGMKTYIASETELRNKVKVIPHGVDTTIFYRDLSKRNQIRSRYDVKDNEVLFMNIGSMTRNKGILEILVTMKLLVFDANTQNVKLLLKGTQDLYESKQFLESYLATLVERNIMTRDQSVKLVESHIIFTDTTFTFGLLNDLYNAADVYISPYLAEGFNLTVLEAITAGLHVLVSDRGSTEGYIGDILKNVNSSDQVIHKIPVEVVNADNNKKMNRINVVDIANLILRKLPNLTRKQSEEDYNNLFNYISKDYSWTAVADQLSKHILTLIESV